MLKCVTGLENKCDLRMISTLECVELAGMKESRMKKSRAIFCQCLA